MADDDIDMEGDDLFQEVFSRQQKAQETRPFTKGSGKAIAHAANARANKVTTVSKPFLSDDEDDDDFQAALRASRKRAGPDKPSSSNDPKPNSGTEATPLGAPNFPGFDGPLPFEKLDFGRGVYR